MSCTVLTIGRTTPCSDTVGGLDYIELCDYDTLGAVTYGTGSNSDVIESFAGSPTWYRYELNSTQNNFVENVVADDDAGTIYYEQVLSLSLKKLDPISHKELKLVAYGRPHVRVVDRNGNQFVAGLLKGCKVTGGTWNTGGALGDFNGYNLTLTGNERTPANFLTGSALAV